MTIQEVLTADWNIDRISVLVRERQTTKYIMRYCIGRDVEAGRSERFHQETAAGNIYINSGMKTLYIRRIIQHCQLKNLPKSKIGLRGILDKEIPKELRALAINQMNPYHCGWSDDLHGYSFTCYVDTWNGINEENKQIELEL